jgi:hypothetical protein
MLRAALASPTTMKAVDWEAAADWFINALRFAAV